MGIVNLSEALRVPQFIWALPSLWHGRLGIEPTTSDFGDRLASLGTFARISGRLLRTRGLPARLFGNAGLYLRCRFRLYRLCTAQPLSMCRHTGIILEKH